MPPLPLQAARAFTARSTETEKLSVVGIPTFVLASATDTDGAFSLFETHDGPNQGPPLHTHRNESESMFVLEGRYLLRIGDKTQDATIGTFAHFPVGIPHTYAQIDPAGGKLLIFTAPGGYESFFRAVDALAARQQLDPYSLTEVAAQFGVEILGPPLVSPC